MTRSVGEPAVDASHSRLDRVLRLAMHLAGAGHALLVMADGDVAAVLGPPLPGAGELALAGVALSQVTAVVAPDFASDGRFPDRPEGVGFFAAAPVLDAGGGLIGALAVADPAARTPPEGFAAILAELAQLAADALGQDGAGRPAKDERDILVAEIDHRVKNVLAAVQSVASQSARRAVSLEGFLKAFSGRLKAMASAQELLTATRWRGASIHDLATAVLSTLAPGQTRWEGPELLLSPRAASALAMALHELAVNAARHGALASESGAVDLTWRAAPGGGFELDWVESGGPRVSTPTRRGFGSLLLEDVTGRELDGSVASDFRSSGLRVHISGSPKALAEGGAAPSAAVAPSPPTAAPAPIAAGQSSGVPATSKVSRVQGMKIIIVEDAILLAMELEAGLQEAGAEILGSAALVEEAMALVDLPMDAAVLDCNLNGLSVGPVAEALAARGVPFLFATGYGENRGAPEGFDAPIIRKPYDVAQIAAALAELTGRA